jgi:hypothetical protein
MTIFKRHEAGHGLVDTHKTERLSSEETEHNAASAADTPSSRWFHTSASSGRKFKFRQRFADEGLESFVSSDSDGHSPHRIGPIKNVNRLSDGDLSLSQVDLSLTRIGPNERITNKKAKDLRNARPRE